VENILNQFAKKQLLYNPSRIIIVKHINRGLKVFTYVSINQHRITLKMIITKKKLFRSISAVIMKLVKHDSNSLHLSATRWNLAI